MVGDDASDLEEKFKIWSGTIFNMLRGDGADAPVDEFGLDLSKVGAAPQKKKVNGKKYLQQQQSKKSSHASSSECCGGAAVADSESTGADNDGSCCASKGVTSETVSLADEEEEEDRINNEFVTMDTMSDDGGEDDDEGTLRWFPSFFVCLCVNVCICTGGEYMQHIVAFFVVASFSDAKTEYDFLLKGKAEGEDVVPAKRMTWTSKIWVRRCIVLQKLLLQLQQKVRVQ